MNRRIALLLCLVSWLAAGAAASARNDTVLEYWLFAHFVNWDGTVSRNDIRIANLPFLLAEREPERNLRLAFPWAAPNCLNCRRSGGRRSARLPHRPLVIRKPIDEASPMLRNADRSKRLLRRIVIKARESSGNEVTIVLRDARIDCFTRYTGGMVPETDEWDFFTLEYGFAGLSYHGTRDAADGSSFAAE